MLTKVLVPLDGSALAEGVLPFVEALACGLHGALTLLHVIDPKVAQEGGRESYTFASTPSTLAFRRAQDYLSRLQRRRSEVPTVDTAVAVGSAPDCIVDFAERGGYDMIAMSTHGRSGVGRWALGTVTDRVLQGTTLPLLVIRPPDRPEDVRPRLPLRRVLVPLDGSDFAAQALPYAAELAHRLRLEIQLVQVIEYQPGLGFALPEEGFAASLENRAEAYLADVQQGLHRQGLTAKGALLWGCPAGPIVQAAQSEPGTIVVMSTHGRSGLGRWALGGVTDKVVRAVRAPVLVIRPQGVRAPGARAAAVPSRDRIAAPGLLPTVHASVS